MKRALALLVSLAAAPALSQGFEAGLAAGYTTPGGLAHEAVGVSDLRLKGSFTWGAGASYFFSERLGLEASWARQETAVEIGTPRGRAEMMDAEVDQFHGSVVLQFGSEHAPLRPHLSAGVGAALLSADELQRETKLGFSVGGGIKWMPTRKAGARLQARYTPIHLNDSSSDFCDPFGFCQDWLHQFELTGGVVVRF
jgi:opacity protein-like surface antigen